MAFNPFIGWTQARLEAALLVAQDDLAYGKTIQSVGAGDAQQSSFVEKKIEERIRNIYKALNILAPVTYPLASIVQIDRTVASFS